MKNLSFIICFFSVLVVGAQDKKQATIEKRAREFHRVITINDMEQWKKFMKDNFSKSLLERPVKSRIETTENESTASKGSTSSADRIEEKVKMFERLHTDFGKSKIIEFKTSNEMIDMVLENASGLKANLNVAFENQKPFLIDRIAVEINERRQKP